jgi:hypothetical protein
MQACLNASNIIARNDCTDAIVTAVSSPDNLGITVALALAALAFAAHLAAKHL